MASRTAVPGTKNTGQTLTAAEINNLPGGWIGYAEITADSNTYGATLADIAGLSQAVTVNTNRKIRIEVDLMDEGGLAEEAFDIMIREGSTVLRKRRYVLAVGSGQTTVHFSHTLNPSSGSHTYKVSAQRVTGSTTHVIKADSGTTWGPASITIFDVGPSA